MGISVRMYLYLLRGHTYDYRYFVYNYKLVRKGRIMKNVLLVKKTYEYNQFSTLPLVPRNASRFRLQGLCTSTVLVEYYRVCRMYEHQYQHTCVLF